MVAGTLQWVGKAHSLGEEPQCQAEAHANGGLFAASKAMAGLLQEATKAWAEQFDGVDDGDRAVSGADLLDWFSDWLLRARHVLDTAGVP